MENRRIDVAQIELIVVQNMFRNRIEEMFYCCLITYCCRIAVQTS
jgi:hypothetical protein